MIYITGDTHGQFKRVEAFCERFQTKREDILIILGDAGINFSGGMRIG
ncbi:MAG: metallophosphoesterase [Hungatella sp.]|jgi:3-oxoacid CoA-transferase subunit A|nr:metallophosphoesterase [Hungatella sp.]